MLSFWKHKQPYQWWKKTLEQFQRRRISRVRLDFLLERIKLVVKRNREWFYFFHLFCSSTSWKALKRQFEAAKASWHKSPKCSWTESCRRYLAFCHPLLARGRDRFDQRPPTWKDGLDVRLRKYGNSYRSICNQTRLSLATIQQIIKETSLE